LDDVFVEAEFEQRIMIIGPTGVGKSAFAATLYQLPVDGTQAVDATLNRLTGGTTAQYIVDLPPIKIKINPTQTVKLHLIDTKGYGDEIHIEENWEIILNNLNNRQKIGGHAGVHAIFYITEPHRLRPADISFMKLLSEHCVVIPIIGKADTMDPRYKQEWKKQLYALLKGAGVEFYKLTDREEILTIAGSELGNLRRYSFFDGDLNLFNENVSDLKEFRRLLYAKFNDIKAQKRIYREKWKDGQLWRKLVIKSSTDFVSKNWELAAKVLLCIVFVLIGFILNQYMSVDNKLLDCNRTS